LPVALDVSPLEPDVVLPVAASVPLLPAPLDPAVVPLAGTCETAVCPLEHAASPTSESAQIIPECDLRNVMRPPEMPTR
jgi:hypothetical protein